MKKGETEVSPLYTLYAAFRDALTATYATRGLYTNQGFRQQGSKDRNLRFVGYQANDVVETSQ